MYFQRMRFKLVLAFLLFSLCGTRLCAQSARITVDLHNSSVKTLIEEIEKQTDYFFIYQDDILNDKQVINISFKDVELNVILQELVKQTFFNVEIINQQIILKKGIEVVENHVPQKRVIQGKVIDEFGRPLTGVSVTLEGSTIGTVTTQHGDFLLEIPEDGNILVFSFIGMTTKKVSLGSDSSINVVLASELIRIEEVVALGYGTIKKTENTGSIASIKTRVFKEFPVTTIEQWLKGHVAGVQVTQSSGQPGAGMSVRIRGVSSIAGGNEPLYVIDGIPTFNSDVRELNGLSGLNPADVSSIEVLKDAIATAIYGSRAANGVILITTKKGNVGKSRINYDSYCSIQNVRKKLPLMNGEEYMDYATEYYSNAQNITGAQRQLVLNAISNYGNANTDWQDEVFRTAIHHGHSLTFSGGVTNNLYYASINYVDQQGIVENTDFEKYGFRLNIQRNLTPWLDITGRTSFSKVIQNGFLTGDGTNARNEQKSGMGATLLVPSTISVYDENGDYSSVVAYPFSYDVMDNPVAMLQALDKNTMYYFLGGLDIETEISPAITNTMRLGLEYTNRTHDYYLPKELLQLGAQTSELQETRIIENIFENFFSVQKNFNDKISMESVFGFSAQWDGYQKISLAGTGFPSDDLLNNSIQAATSVSTPETIRTKTTLASFFGRINLGYLNKYHLSLSTRYDGSSVFSENHKWATFPAIGFAWRLNEENFFTNEKVSNLKLRTSWGLSGNQAIQPYQSLFVGEIVNTGQGSGSGINVGLAPSLSNKDLTWETTAQYNLGIDYGMYNERFRFIFDYYVRNTRDLLANVALPGSAGYSYYVDNAGSVQNKGFEFVLGADVINKNDWKMALDFNFSRNRNEVKSTKNNQDIVPSNTDDASRTTVIVRIGEPLFSFYLPHFAGIDEDTGKPVYVDLNNDGIIDDADNQIAGSSLPDFFYGLDFSIRHRNISLTMKWQGVSGAKLHNVTMNSLTDPEPLGNRLKNIREYYPRVSDDYTVWDSDRFIEDASYLRLKNIKLSYNINKLPKMIEDFTVYISGQNLLTFTNYSGYDPEVNSFSNNNQLQGIDYAAFPSAKTITFGINMSF